MRVLVACEFSGVVREAFRSRGHDTWSCDLLPAEDGSPFHYQGDVLDMLYGPAAHSMALEGQRVVWDLMIAHPPCTYLSASGMHWTTRGLRDPKLTDEAMEFVRRLMGAPIPRIAVENPVGVISTRLRKPDQIVQPWMFGDDASKKTCLWLKNLPPLRPAADTIVPPKGWEQVLSAADMALCPDCGEPFCPKHREHYADCDCIGPTEDDVTTKEVDGILFGTRARPAPRMIWGNQTPSGQNRLGPSPDRWKKRSRTYRGIATAMASQWGGDEH
jgi:hypothetical protein